jgi:hypothetical protein
VGGALTLSQIQVQNAMNALVQHSSILKPMKLGQEKVVPKLERLEEEARARVETRAEYERRHAQAMRDRAGQTLRARRATRASMRESEVDDAAAAAADAVADAEMEDEDVDDVLREMDAADVGGGGFDASRTGPVGLRPSAAVPTRPSAAAAAASSGGAAATAPKVDPTRRVRRNKALWSLLEELELEKAKLEEERALNRKLGIVD